MASYAFSGYKFKEIYFPSTIKYMNQSVFQGCYDLKKISITLLNKSGGYYYLHELLSAYPSERGNFYFDEVIVSVPTLTGNLFEGCNIKRITVNNAGMVMTDAFKGINNLEEIVLTTGAAYIYLDAFNGVENANIYFEKNSLANYDYNISSTNKVYLYSETEPTTSGNYWHYVDGEIVVWGEKLCTITYIVDGNVYLVEQKNIGDYLNCPINVEKTGYEFKGWYDENDRYYYAGDYVVSNYTLYAKFEPVVSPGVYLADISSNPLYEYEFK